jgi:hypothetical protein
MTWKSYAAVSGAGLLATYLFSTPAPFAPPPALSSPGRPVEATPSAPADIEEQAARLQSRVPRETSYQEPARNPFRFGARRASRPSSGSAPAAASAPVDVPIAPPVVDPPVIRVSGIATHVVDGVRLRTAILLTPGGFAEVREGDPVPGGYRVVRIDEDAIELIGSDGTSRRVLLRP